MVSMRTVRLFNQWNTALLPSRENNRALMVQRGVTIWKFKIHITEDLGTYSLFGKYGIIQTIDGALLIERADAIDEF